MHFHTSGDSIFCHIANREVESGLQGDQIVCFGCGGVLTAQEKENSHARA